MDTSIVDRYFDDSEERKMQPYFDTFPLNTGDMKCAWILHTGIKEPWTLTGVHGSMSEEIQLPLQNKNLEIKRETTYTKNVHTLIIHM